MEMDERIKYALEHTELIRRPQQTLATFGDSAIDYYVITELASNFSVVRDGKVIAARPRIVTPSYLVNVEGFSEDARGYIKMMARENPNDPGIIYRYKNEPREMHIVSEPIKGVVDRLNALLDEQGNPLSIIIKGVEELWDVSLLMFISDLTRRSIHDNALEFQRKGLLDVDNSGLPKGARDYIEYLFEQVREDLSRAPQLASELNRWGVFNEYEDRFLALFRRR